MGAGLVQNNEENIAERARSDRGARRLLADGQVCADGLGDVHFSIFNGLLKFNSRDKGFIIRRVNALHFGFHALGQWDKAVG